MEKETMGTVISVIKQWWLKVNRKPARVHAMDGAAFPHTIKVKYTIDGKDYICRKWIGAGNKVLTREQRLKLSIVKISHRKQELNSNQ
ncbi:sugar ABC transporter permease [Roseburia sp. AM51-8]|uniref:sugar ABC transporter permease n=1 Tax=Roseburia sp. AM51-8 TaxID=2292366 RepID=UPI001FAB2737|nr:sugar ABC transporter permease [Roseburia sp. AM51-8]